MFGVVTQPPRMPLWHRSERLTYLCLTDAPVESINHCRHPSFLVLIADCYRGQDWNSKLSLSPAHASMAPIGEAFFPLLDRCFSGEHQLLKYLRSSFAARQGARQWHSQEAPHRFTEDGILNRHLTDPQTIDIPAQSRHWPKGIALAFREARGLHTSKGDATGPLITHTPPPNPTDMTRMLRSKRGCKKERIVSSRKPYTTLKRDIPRFLEPRLIRWTPLWKTRRRVSRWTLSL